MSAAIDRLRDVLALCPTGGVFLGEDYVRTVVSALDALDAQRARAEAAETEVARLRSENDRTKDAAHRLSVEWHATSQERDRNWLRYRRADDDRLSTARQLRATEAERDAARADAAALRAIVEGRTAPPTDEEIEAHAAAGGVWLVTRRSGFGRAIAYDSDEARRLATWPDTRWWALDATGRPCAWPTVTP